MVNQYTIATLGSHSALQILHGAKKEGFKTLLITTKEKMSLYRRFEFIDEYLEISSFKEFPAYEKKLKSKNIIIVPHGSFVAYLGTQANKDMKLLHFGSKAVLDWESKRDKQHRWLSQAKILLPQTYSTIHDAKFPVIVKKYGAAGGSGYFVAGSREEFDTQIKNLDTDYTIQQYIVGVPLYIHYFYSPLTGKMEVMSMDRRYETDVDAIGRLPARDQLDLAIKPTFTVVGNSPLVIRESLLEECFQMGERVVQTSQKLIGGKGLYGPFCLETIITPDQKIYTIEISTRIVAGTNLFTHGSAYSYLSYDESMSTGRRIAREIKNAIKENKLEQILE